MIAYFDTSALVPLVIAEPTTAACRAAWDAASQVVCCRIAEVEAAAALAAALRGRRLDRATHDRAVDGFDAIWEQVDTVDIDAELVAAAKTFAFELALRGYDAVHCAAFESIADRETVLVAGDRDLLNAGARLGLATWDVTRD